MRAHRSKEWRGFQKDEGVAGCVESCGEIKKEQTEISQGTSNMEIVSDLEKSSFSGW